MIEDNNVISIVYPDCCYYGRRMGPQPSSHDVVVALECTQCPSVVYED